MRAVDTELEDDDYYDDPTYAMSQEAAQYYVDEIQTELDRDSSDLNKARGLMEHYYGSDPAVDKSVDGKVRSLFVGVEVHEGKLWGVATIERTEQLTPTEYARLKEYINGQYADGFGEGFEQREIKVGEQQIYVSLWSSDGGFFIDTQREFERRLGIIKAKETPSQKPSLADTLARNAARSKAEFGGLPSPQQQKSTELEV